MFHFSIALSLFRFSHIQLQPMTPMEPAPKFGLNEGSYVELKDSLILHYTKLSIPQHPLNGSHPELGK